MHPAQQQGLLMPLCILEMATETLRSRVSDFLADSTQQIHSLRASGVISSQSFKATGDAVMAFRRSCGSLLCTVPAGSLVVNICISLLPDDLILNVWTGVSRLLKGVSEPLAC